MQQAEQANSRKTPQASGGNVSRISCDPLGEIYYVTAHADVIGTLIQCARSHLEDVAMGRIVGPSTGLIDNLLSAIDIVHDQEVRCVIRAEEALHANGVEAYLNRRAA